MTIAYMEPNPVKSNVYKEVVVVFWLHYIVPLLSLSLNSCYSFI